MNRGVLGVKPLGEGVVRSLRSLSSFLRKLAERGAGAPFGKENT